MKSSSNIISGTDGTKQLVTYSKTQQKIVRQLVRSDDEYLSHLGSIIQRDFFPDLAEFKGEAPATAPSEGSESPFGLPTQNPLRDPTSVSLDKYLANNTTEDNASFIEIIEDAERKREARLAQFFPSRSANGSKLATSEKGEYLTLALESASSSTTSSACQLKVVKKSGLVEATTTNKTSVPTLDSITSHNAVHFIPDGAPLTPDELTQHFNRDRSICPANSRFKRPFAPVLDRRKLAGMGGALKVGRFGIDGKEVTSLTDSPMATPHAGGYKFMDASPSPSLSAFDGGSTPMMTWGELDSTPYRLDRASGITPIVSSGTPLASFHIPSPSKRETIAHELADKAGKQRAKHRANAVKLAKSGFLSPHTSKVALSPAARRLLSNSSKLTFGAHPNSGFPTPVLTGGVTPRRLPSDLGVIRRPSSSVCGKPLSPPRRLDDELSAPPALTDSLTNDLLNLSGGRNAISSPSPKKP